MSDVVQDHALQIYQLVTVCSQDGNKVMFSRAWLAGVWTCQ